MNSGNIHKKRYWSEMSISFLAMSALLPLLLIAVMKSQDLKTIINAGEPPELRIWFEPAQIVTHPGVKFKIKIMADYEDKVNLIQKIEAVIRKSDQLSVKPLNIKYDIPFSGTKELGACEVTANSTGDFDLDIPNNGVFTQTTDLDITTAKAVIYSKP